MWFFYILNTWWERCAKGRRQIGRREFNFSIKHRNNINNSGKPTQLNFIEYYSLGYIFNSSKTVS